MSFNRPPPAILDTDDEGKKTTYEERRDREEIFSDWESRQDRYWNRRQLGRWVDSVYHDQLLVVKQRLSSLDSAPTAAITTTAKTKLHTVAPTAVKLQDRIPALPPPPAAKTILRRVPPPSTSTGAQRLPWQ